jgi:hypothetical protein
MSVSIKPECENKREQEEQKSLQCDITDEDLVTRY